ncbi:Concanavalin A-like lectin/glucanase domain superfamily [Arabidopsis suecica]|uniref:Xyloglucan endotransglucosylase/hydrolase n=1 Tax=Arabidopsis suecica TaxID=45249 RepID=A0A8T1YPJ3_ARASU|nr:Concanavalin A-like lectin/glucanase domain superfamily [Arabidopsis suecica]
MNKMGYISIFGLVSVLYLIIRVDARAHEVKGIDQNKVGFDDNYVVTWGQNNALKLNQGKEVQLSLDRSSGSGFESKNHYESGFFQIRIKVPPKDSSGIVTAFYLTSKENTHDELDIEFLGNKEGKPIRVQTNVFTNGKGDREQKLVLWFDPTKDFHTYAILWNPYQIVFYVDNIPIRVFKNTTSEGMNYPSKPMQVVVSLWNGEDWATDGGKSKINWALAPFKANFQGFNNSGCFANGEKNACGSSTYWWNTGSYSKLSDSEQKAYTNVRQKYMNYDYCSDKVRFHVPPSECKWNN